MAGYSPSPTSVAGTNSMHPGRRSPSPPALPISKRDKKRNQHIQLQQDLIEDFTLNRDPHYKAQLIALQYDMSLITQADPYNPEPMEDSPDEIARAVEEAAAGTPYQADMSKMAGRWYSEFVHEVNEAKEAKEIELTQLRVSNRPIARLRPFWEPGSETKHHTANRSTANVAGRATIRRDSPDSSTNVTTGSTLRPKSASNSRRPSENDWSSHCRTKSSDS
jgi:hypothetical protein